MILEIECNVADNDGEYDVYTNGNVTIECIGGNHATFDFSTCEFTTCGLSTISIA